MSHTVMQSDAALTAEVMTVDVLSPSGEKTETVDLPATHFGVRTNIALIHQVVVAQLAAARAAIG